MLRFSRFLLLFGMTLCSTFARTGDLRPWSENPFYWQLDGSPVLLLGGSVEDNLYQIPELEEHLRLLASVGGNYVRCTMSGRDEGNRWWFARDAESGRYDLNELDPEHWRRFETLLALCAELGIVVQIELWDRFDFAKDPWDRNPYNPKNNRNYTAEESGLPVENDNPGPGANPFFQTVPALRDNAVVLPFQQRQVDRLLAASLRYGNVLYCMDNETDEAAEWGRYWSEYIKAKAAEEGVSVMTTEMWNQHDLFHEEHRRTLDHPETYDFVDISQNNHNDALEHWANALEVRRYVADSGHPRPINSIKIYGNNARSYGTTRDGQERLWRNVLAGLASARFHRPPHGLGLNEIARENIRALRMALAEHDIFAAVPARELLRNRSPREAWASAVPGKSYLIYFPDGGDLLLDVSAVDGRPLTIHWLDIRQCAWTGAPAPIEAENGRVRVATPREEGYWTAVIAAE